MVKSFKLPFGEAGRPRTVYIYLPKGWQAGGRWPVMYMFDGHNLFSDAVATYGKCWGMKDYLDARPACIVVGVDCNHEGNNRLVEYCPYDVRVPRFGHIPGTGAATMEWFVHTLKPWVDAHYPTKPDRANTFVGGSSMGGLMSIYAEVAYNEVFAGAACLSSSLRLCMPQLRALLGNAKLRPDTKMYLSWGGKEHPRPADDTAKALEIARLLQLAGAEVWPRFWQNAHHCEADWEPQIPEFMPYLLGEAAVAAAEGKAPKATRRQSP